MTKVSHKFEFPTTPSCGDNLGSEPPSPRTDRSGMAESEIEDQIATEAGTETEIGIGTR